MDSKRPKVVASFPRQSYGPGSKARLVFVSSAKGVTMQFFRAGTEAKRIKANDIMLGSSVSAPSRLERVASPHGAGPDRQLAERTVLRAPDC